MQVFRDGDIAVRHPSFGRALKELLFISQNARSFCLFVFVHSRRRWHILCSVARVGALSNGSVSTYINNGDPAQEHAQGVS